MKLGARVNIYTVLDDALDRAVTRGIARHDKYSEKPLKANVQLLSEQIEQSFWLALEDMGVELVSRD